MTWTNVTYMEEINRFVILARSGRFTVTELCEQFGISRKTGYKHLERYAAIGLAGLQPHSHRPHHSPQRTDEGVEALILADALGQGELFTDAYGQPAAAAREPVFWTEHTRPDDQRHPSADAPESA